MCVAVWDHYSRRVIRVGYVPSEAILGTTFVLTRSGELTTLKWRISSLDNIVPYTTHKVGCFRYTALGGRSSA